MLIPRCCSTLNRRQARKPDGQIFESIRTLEVREASGRREKEEIEQLVILAMDSLALLKGGGINKEQINAHIIRLHTILQVQL